MFRESKLPVVVLLTWLVSQAPVAARGVWGCEHISVNAPTQADAQWTVSAWHFFQWELVRQGQPVPARQVIIHWDERSVAPRVSAWLADKTTHRRRHIVWIVCDRQSYPRVLKETVRKLGRLEKRK